MPDFHLHAIFLLQALAFPRQSPQLVLYSSGAATRQCSTAPRQVWHDYKPPKTCHATAAADAEQPSPVRPIAYLPSPSPAQGLLWLRPSSLHSSERDIWLFPLSTLLAPYLDIADLRDSCVGCFGAYASVRSACVVAHRISYPGASYLLQLPCPDVQTSYYKCLRVCTHVACLLPPALP